MSNVANNQNYNIYGTCMSTVASGGTIDIAPGVQASGVDVLAQSLVRRQMTPRGSALDAPNDGIDVRTFIKVGMTQTEVSQIPGVIRNELLRDERVKTCTVTASFNQVTNTMTIVENIQSAAGPFTLTLSVTSVTVSAILNSQ